MVLEAFMAASHKVRRQQIAVADQVVTGQSQQRGILHLVAASELRSSQMGGVLAPAEGVLDQLPCPQAQRVSDVAGRASVNLQAAIAFDGLGNMRRRVDLPQFDHETAGVVGLVRGDRGARLVAYRLNHLDALDRSVIPLASLTSTARP